MQKWVFVLLGIAAFAWWLVARQGSTKACVQGAISLMQEATKQVPGAEHAGEMPTLSAAQIRAVEALRRCGVKALPALVAQLRIGVRPRRLAILALAMGVSEKPPWRKPVLAAMWQAMSHEGWRVRELAFTVLWHRLQKPEKRALVLARASADSHAFLRYLAAKVSRGKSPAAKPLNTMLVLLHKGVRKPGSSADLGHSHGAGHKGHNHQEHTPKGPKGGVEGWLRGRSLCRIDSDDDWPARQLIVQGLSKWKLPMHRKVHHWIDALYDRHEAVRKSARAALIAQGQKVLPSLGAVMQRAPTPRKHKVATILGAMGPAAVSVLVLMFRDPSPAIWHAAARGLQASGAHLPPHVPVLCKLSLQNPAKRRALASILAVAGARGQACLLGQLVAKDVHARRLAARGIGLLLRAACQVKGKPRACQATPLLQAVLPKLLLRLGDVSPDVQAEVLWAMGQAEGAATQVQTPLLAGLATLHKRPLQVQQAWLAALAQIGHRDAVIAQALLKWLANPAHAMPAKVSLLRRWATRQGLRLATVKTLAGYLRAPHRKLRSASRDILDGHREHQGVLLPLLLKQLNEPKPALRASVALALARWRRWPSTLAPRAARRMTFFCLYDRSKMVQQAAALALLQMGRHTKGIVPPRRWLRLLRHRQWQIRMNAAKTLAALGPSAAFAVPFLIPRLRDKRRQVRRAAALALGKIGKAAAPAQRALKEAMGDRAIDVQHAAKRALANVRTANQAR